MSDTTIHPPCTTCGISYDVVERRAAIDLFNDIVYLAQCEDCGRFTKKIGRDKITVVPIGSDSVVSIARREGPAEEPIVALALAPGARGATAESYFEPILTVIDFWNKKLVEEGSGFAGNRACEALQNVRNCVEDQILRFADKDK